MSGHRPRETHFPCKTDFTGGTTVLIAELRWCAGCASDTPVDIVSSTEWGCADCGEAWTGGFLPGTPAEERALPLAA